MDSILWENYARQYDRVVCRNKISQSLLDRLTGADGQLAPPPQGARALDLGGGTGALALKLATADPSAHVTHVDHEPAMLELCRGKCAAVLAGSGRAPGVRIVEADLTGAAWLRAVDGEPWDLAFMVNVLYTLPEPGKLLRSVSRLLRPGGELRLSEPRTDTHLDVLLATLKANLDVADDSGREVLWADFEAVQRFNSRTLDPHLHRWTTGQMVDLLRDSGFRLIVYASETVYAEQSMAISART
jgi:ubiquinone/menaquinone biosynthesis C-methylase UbiE